MKADIVANMARPSKQRRTLQSNADDNLPSRRPAPTQAQRSKRSQASIAAENARKEEALMLYDSLRPKDFTCPFADPSRANPCTALPVNPKRPKESVTKHLRVVWDKKGDEQHPVSDILWKSNLIEHFYFKKRGDFLITSEDPEEAKKISNDRHYRKRKKRLDLKGGPEKLKEAYQNKEIDAKEYKKLLVGKSLVLFLQEQAAEKKAKEAREEERRVRQQLETRIAQLQQDLQSNTNPEAGRQLAEQLERFDKIKKDFDDSSEVLDRFEKQLLAIYREIPHWVGSDTKDFADESSPTNLLTFAGLEFPETVNETTYYYYAALCIPMAEWGKRKPWSDSQYRKIAGTLEEVVGRSDTLLQSADTPAETKEEATRRLQERRHAIQTALNSSWQLIRDDEFYVNPDHPVLEDLFDLAAWDPDESESWEARQERQWKQAQDQVRDAFLRVVARPRTSVISICLDISDFANMAKEMSRVEKQVQIVGDQLNNGI